ncbi:MAG: gliding motility-associated C-terminal domain-containing protein [Lewinella sp.]|nr:gliding motility-associated C-terminal domain-containing protein [Lewinella sp.]
METNFNIPRVHMYRKQLTNIYLFSLLGMTLLTGNQIYAQCPRLKAIMVDACGNEPGNEFIILHSGTGFNTQDLQIDFDQVANGGVHENNDINVSINNFPGDPLPCRFQPGDPSLVGNCPNVRSASQGEEIPANAIVIIQMSGDADVEYDFSYLCGNGECVYVLQNDCIRTKEAFPNKGSGSIDLQIAIRNTACMQTYDYDRNRLVGSDGAFYAPEGTSLYENRGCETPPVRGATIPPDYVDPGPQIGCGSYILPAIGGLNLTGNERYYTLPGGGGIEYKPGDRITRTITLFIFDKTSPCSLEPFFRITITTPGAPVLSVPSPLCESEPSFPLEATPDGIKGVWSGPGVSNNIFDPGAAGPGTHTLTFTPDADQCANPNTTDVRILSSPGGVAGLTLGACDDLDTGLGAYDLTSLEPEVNPSGTGTVVWYEDENLTTPISDPTAFISPPTTVYAVIETTGGCPSNPAPVDLLLSPAIIIGFDAFSGISCNGDTNGSADISIQGGTPPYQIFWSDPAFDGSEIITDLGAGEYIVSVVDATGCEKTMRFEILDPPLLTLNCNTEENVSTVTGQDGVGSVTVNGGLPPYTISWSGPKSGSITVSSASPLIIDHLPAGAYDINVRDALGCIMGCQFVVNAPNCNLTASATRTLPSCFDSDDGSISITTAGGQGVLSYAWNVPGLNGMDQASGLASGHYEITVSDQIGCSQVVTVELIAPPALDLICAPQNTPSYLGADDGTARIRVSGGTPPYQLSWTGPVSGSASINVASEYIIDQLSAGNYDISVIDDHGCEMSCSFVLPDGLCNTFVNATAVNESCPDEADGSISLSLNGDWITPVTIDWNVNAYDGQTDLTDLAPGTYSVTVTGSNSCQASASVTIGTDFTPPSLDIAPTAEICEGACFTYTLQFSGEAPFTAEFEISNGGQTFPVTVSSGSSSGELTICPDDYGIVSGSIRIQLLRVSDANCVNTETKESELTILTPVETLLDPILCPSDSITVNGQVYNINRPQGREIISGAAQNGCDSIINIDLSFLPERSSTVTDTLCPEESITVNGQIYDFDHPSGVEIIPTSNGCDSLVRVELTFFPREPGLFQATLCSGEEITVNGHIYNEDHRTGTEIFPGAGAHGCDSLLEVRILFLDVSNGFLTPTICPGEDFEYNGQIFNENNPSGSVLLPGQAESGCDSLVWIELDFYDIAIGIYSDTICPGEQVEINGTIYDISNPSGTEVLIDASAAGCDSIVQVSLSFFDAPMGSFTPTICRGDQITFNGTIYDENHPSGTEVFPGQSEMGCDSIVQVQLSFYDVPTGSYTPTICRGDQITYNGTVYDENNPSGTEVLPGQSAMGCDSMVQVQLNFYDVPIGSYTPTICRGDQITYNGTVYDENNPSGIEVLPGQSAMGCDSMVQVQLNFYETPVGAYTPSICPGDQIIYNGTIYDENNPSGIEILSGQSAMGCDSLVEVTVSFYDIPVGVFRDTICRDASVIINGSTYDINHPTGTELLEGVSALGCDSVVQVELSFLENITVSLLGDQIVCSNESAELEIRITNAPGPIDIQYSTNGVDPVWLYGLQDGDKITVSPTQTSTYQITDVATPDGYCAVDILESVFIEVQEVAVSIVIDSKYDDYQISCFDRLDGALSTQVQGIAPFRYVWENGSTSSQRTQLGPGTYSVTVSDAMGCRAEAQATLLAPPEVSISAEAISPNCNSSGMGSIIINSITGGNAYYDIQLNGEPVTTSNQFPQTINGLSPGIYTLTATDEFGCSSEREIFIPEYMELSLELGENKFIKQGESVRLDGVVNFDIDSLVWTSSTSIVPPNELPVRVTPLETTEYRLTAYDRYGCSVSDRITVFVSKQGSIYLPNAFSPNADGKNDTFYPFTDGSIEEILIFRIFDRWGNLMFERRDFQGNQANLGWDGKADGVKMKPAVFIYLLQVKFIDGSEEMFKGDVSLVK